MTHSQPSTFYSRAIAFALALLFLFLPLLYQQHLVESVSLPRYIWITAIALLLLLTDAWQSLRCNTSQQPDYQWTHWHSGLTLFFLFSGLSYVWSVDTANTLIEISQLAVFFVIAFYASQLEPRELPPVFAALFTGAAIAAALGVLQAFAINPFHLPDAIPMSTTFGNKNHAAVYFDLVIPLALIRMLVAKGCEKYLAILAFTLATSFVLISKTKGSLLGYMVFFLVLLFFVIKNPQLRARFLTRNTLKYLLSAGLLVPAALYLTANSNFNPANSQQAGSSKQTRHKTVQPASWNAGLKTGSVQIRLAFYQNALVLLSEHPATGTGYGAFRKGFAPHAANPNPVSTITEDFYVNDLHNDPLQMLVELGVIGGGWIVGLYLLLLFKGSRQLLQQSNNLQQQLLLLATVLALLSSLTHSLVDFPLQLPSSALLFWVVTGWLVLSLSPHSLRQVRSFPRNRLTGGILLGLFVLLGGYSMNMYADNYRASSHTYQAIAAIVKNRDCDTARQHIDKAMDLFAADAFVRQRYAKVYSYCDIPPDTRLAAMNRVLALDNATPRALLTRGEVYLQMKNWPAAKSDFLQLIRLLPHRASGYNGLGDIATLQKNYTTARKFYQLALNVQPSNQKAHQMLQQFERKGL